MGLHPYYQRLRTERKNSNWVPSYELTVDEARQADLNEIRRSAGNPEPIKTVDTLIVPSEDAHVPIRIYRSSDEKPLPVLVYFFGGGWTLGSLETCDRVCRRLAIRGGFAVAAVGYRLAPENKFPSALQDCYAATTWLATHGSRVQLDAGRVAVAGDSAGGNLAAAVTLMARDKRAPRLAFQVLVYPVTDYMADTQTMQQFVDRYLFNRDSMRWYWNHYLSSPGDAANPYAAPLRAQDFSGLPPALVITAEVDPLRDEGEAYARKLMDAAVPVELSRYVGMAHGFFGALGDLSDARAAVDQVADRVRKTFSAVG